MLIIQGTAVARLLIFGRDGGKLGQYKLSIETIISNFKIVLLIFKLS